MADHTIVAKPLRELLLPYADLIERCFERSLTVQQCAEYLAFLRDRRESLPVDRLNSEEGEKAIQEVFWKTQAQKTLAVFFRRLLGHTGVVGASWFDNVRAAVQARPSFLSWLPAASRKKLEALEAHRTA